jgi:hypothetical protein
VVTECDDAEIDVETVDTSGPPDGSPTSPPPHWQERGKPQFQASLIVDPPDGRAAAIGRSQHSAALNDGAFQSYERQYRCL